MLASLPLRNGSQSRALVATTTMESDNLCLGSDRVISMSTLEKKTAHILNDTSVACFPGSLRCSWIKREKRGARTAHTDDDDRMRSYGSTTPQASHDRSCTRVYELESVYGLCCFSRLRAKSAQETCLPSFSPVLLLRLFPLFDFKGGASVFLFLADFVVTEGWPPREVSDNDVFLEVLSSSSDNSDCIFLSSSVRRSTSFRVSPLIPLKYSMGCLHTSLR